MILPTFIGIGAPKTGTTWLSAKIVEHPEAFMSTVKEIEFWKFRDAASRLEDYETYFRGGRDCEARGEFSVRYLAFPGVAERIASTIPKVRLVLSVRRPVDQVQSWYWHLRRQGLMNHQNTTKPMPIEQAMVDRPELLLEYCRYHHHLSKWLEIFPRDQLLVVLFDDIKTRPQSVMRQVFKHIGVSNSFVNSPTVETGFHARAGVSPKSALHDRVHQITYRMLNRYAYQPLQRVVGAKRARTLNSKLGVRRLMEKTLFQQGYPGLPRSVHQRLHEFTCREVELLSPILTRDLSTWLS